MDRRYLHQLLIAFDQLLNALLAGYADETLSSRAWRSQDKRRWRVTRKTIDAVFFWQKDHCKQSYLSELNGNHSPDVFKPLPPELEKYKDPQ